jgi:capsular polysaccharide biosynthesis protein
MSGTHSPPRVVVRNIAVHAATQGAEGIAFSPVAAASRTPPPPPLFLLGPGNSAIFEELFAQTATDAVGCYRITDATLAPTGVAIRDGVAFSSPSFLHPSHHVAQVAARTLSLDAPEHHVRGPLAVIYGPGHETYGHWLVDFLPRLWVLARAGYDIHTLRYAVPPNLVPVAVHLLGRAGVRPSQLVLHRYWKETMRTDVLLMPTGLRTQNRVSACFADATRFWAGGLLRASAHLPGAGARLFISRARMPAARVLPNRAGIEAIAAARGYAIVHPQTMSLPAQAAMFARARAVVGEYGSGLHGSVFSPPATVVVGLRGTARHPSFVQSGVCAALGQRAGYVLGPTQGEVEQSFMIQPEDFERALDLVEIFLDGSV